MRVHTYLADHQVPFDTLLHPPAFTAQKRAKYLHVPGRQVAKCVLLAGAEGYILAVLPATHHVDTETVGRELGSAFRLANSEEIAEVFRDCEWGVLTPFGTLYGIATILDERIEPETSMIFEAHEHGLAIRMSCRDYEQLEKPRRFRFAR
jgi:Ala-tRNA(Pro) deacylase